MLRYLMIVLVGIIIIAAVGCGGGAKATPTPKPSPTPVATATPAPRATPTPTRAAALTPTQAPTTGPSLEQGKKAFVAQCGVCHKIEGVSTGAMGPELTKIGTVAATRKAGMSADAYIRESVEKPNALVVTGFPPAMPPGLKDQMSKEDYEALVQYLLSLK